MNDPLHCTSDRPCLFLFPLLDIYFCFCPPPHHFSNGPPLTYEKSRFAKPMGNGEEFSHTREKLSSNRMIQESKYEYTNTGKFVLVEDDHFILSLYEYRDCENISREIMKRRM